MNYQIVIATVIAAILVVGFVSTTVTVFADSNQVKIQQKQNNHLKCGQDSICAGNNQGGDQTAAGVIEP